MYYGEFENREYGYVALNRVWCSGSSLVQGMMLPFSVLKRASFGPKAILKLLLEKVVKVGDDLIMLYET